MGAVFQLSQVKFGYSKSTTVLDMGERSFEQGTITSLVGSNGAGKSTLLGLLAFLYLPESGEIKYRDQIVNNSILNRLRKKVGLVQQNPYLIRGTVYKNIELGLRFHGIDAHERETRIKKIINQLKLESLIQRPVKSLSGGEAQKVAIARSLVLDPDVLLLDEPFTYLDRKFIRELETLIENLRNQQNKTVIFTTHNLLQAQALSDKVYSMIKGDLIEASLTNLFHGHIDKTKHLFDTGKMQITIPEDCHDGSHLVIDPAQIVLSRDQLDSSMRNSFQGEITGLLNENGHVRVIIDGHEQFHAFITHDALKKLGFHINERVMLSFKSSSVNVF